MGQMGRKANERKGRSRPQGHRVVNTAQLVHLACEGLDATAVSLSFHFFFPPSCLGFVALHSMGDCFARLATGMWRTMSGGEL